MRLLKLFSAISVALLAGCFSAYAEKEWVVTKTDTSTTVQKGEQTLWTYNHDPTNGKPYFHPLSSSDGTMFTDLPKTDHPWHRGLWFSWKYINGVNYWEEKGYTGVPREGYTRLLSSTSKMTESKSVQIHQKLEYAPSIDADSVLKENRTISVSHPDAMGVYQIDWSCRFVALEEDVVLDRTPLPGEPDGKPHGGYAGFSLRMNKQVGATGKFVNQEGLEGMDTRRAASAWELFDVPEGGTLMLMDHPENLNYPSKWFVSTKMPFMSPAVIHDGPHTIKADETFRLKYRIVLSPETLSKKEADKLWKIFAQSK